MVASSAFQELSAVLARLESSGTEVQHAAMDEDLTSTDGTVTADLSVGVPVLSDAETSEAVSIEAVDATVEDGRVAVDLTVTVSGDDTTATDTLSLGPRRGDGTGASSESVPAYKDPEALRAAYERYETFPEMTDALGVDVTAETVRRHMVKYDIHDPDETTPQYADAATAVPDDESDDEHSDHDDHDETVDSEDADSRGDTATADVDTQETEAESPASGTESTPETEPIAGSAVTDGGNVAVAEPRSRERPPAPSPVTEVLAESAADASGETRVDTRFDLPDSVTVGELTDAINGSRTVHELARRLGVSQSVARTFLKEFDLIHFVSHPLAANQVTVSPDEVRRRLGPETR